LVSVVAIAATATVGGKVREIFGGTTNIIGLASNGYLAGASPSLIQGVVMPPPAPTINTTSVPAAVLSTSYSQALSATGPNGDGVVWTVGSGLPSGMSLSSSGLLSGTPTAAGSYSFAVLAIDSVTAMASSQPLALLVASPPTISTSTLPNGKISTVYAQMLSATDPQSLSMGWAVSGSLPPGIALNPVTGGLSGTPTSTGTFNFTATATDSAGASSPPKSLSILVAP